MLGKKSFLIFATLAFATIALMGLTGLASRSGKPGAPIVERDLIFAHTIGNGIELNQSLTLVPMSNGLIYEGPPQPETVAVMVLNHSEEGILFEDINYELEVYHYDEVTAVWQIVPLQFWPQKKPIVLPAKTKRFDPELWNRAILWVRTDLPEGAPPKIRLLVRGVGVSSQKPVGAYLDVVLATP